MNAVNIPQHGLANNYFVVEFQDPFLRHNAGNNLFYLGNFTDPAEKSICQINQNE